MFADHYAVRHRGDRKNWRRPRRYKVAAMVALLVSVASPPVSASSTATAENSVVEVRSYNAGAVDHRVSGVVVSSDSHVVVPAFIFDRGERVSVLDPNTGAVIESKFVVSNDDLGLAVVHAPGLGLQPAGFAKDPARAGMLIRSASRTDTAGGQLVLSRGSVGRAFVQKTSDAQIHMLEHNAMITRRGYGGSLLNDCDEVVGINRPNPDLWRLTVRRGVDPDNAVIAVPADEVIELLRTAKVVATMATAPCLTDVERTKESAEDAERKATEAERKATEAEKDAADAKTALEKAAAAAKQRQEELQKETATLKEEAEKAEAELKALDEDGERLRTELDKRSDTILYISAFSALVLLLIGMYYLRRHKQSAAAIDSALREAESARGRAAAAEQQIHAHPSRFNDLMLEGVGGRKERIAVRVSGAELAQATTGLILGRNPAHAQIVIDDPEVSRAHARLELRQGSEGSTLFLSDLQSTNGTFVNGTNTEVHAGGCQLKQGDEILLGSIRVTVRIL